MTQLSELVVVANRLPVEYREAGDGFAWVPSPGGLVSALEPALRDRSAVWVGWTGPAQGAEEAAPVPTTLGSLRIVAVSLDEEEARDYYEGFSNGALWPLFHDALVPPVYHRSEFESYVAVNRHFAQAVSDVAAPGGTVWVHDYQLQLVPQILRTLRPDVRIGFFLHIPFPAVQMFAQLPWRRQILQGLLGADLLGFQTLDDARNSRAAVRRLVPAAAGSQARRVHVKAFPIGIDATSFAETAASETVQSRAKEIREEMGGFPRLLLGIDRLDYTKGIGVRLRAFSEALEEGLLDSDQVTMLQVAIPSRGSVEEYQRIRDDVDLLVGRVNVNWAKSVSPPSTICTSR